MYIYRLLLLRYMDVLMISWVAHQSEIKRKHECDESIIAEDEDSKRFRFDLENTKAGLQNQLDEIISTCNIIEKN